MSLISRLKRLLGAAQPRPQTRLAESEALAFARAAIAAQDQAVSDPLFVQAIRENAAGVTWFVRTATKGAWWLAEIDDRTGAVTALRRHGIR